MRSNPLGGSAFRQIRGVQKTHNNRNSRSGTLHPPAFSSQDQDQTPHPQPCPQGKGDWSDRGPLWSQAASAAPWTPCPASGSAVPAPRALTCPPGRSSHHGVIDRVVEENSGSPWSFNDFRSRGGMSALIYSATRAEDPQGTKVPKNHLPPKDR